MPKCTVEDCDSNSRANGLCNKHLCRLRQTGTTDPGPKAHAAVEDRLRRHFSAGNNYDCWLWVGDKNAAGYGRICVGGKGGGLKLAHRVAWEAANGRSIPPDMVIMHKCDNPACVNPAHLVLGTQTENIYDMHAKRRHKVPHAKGVDHHSCKLTEEQVRDIRSSEEHNEIIAARLGVTRHAISRIRSRKTWKHLE